MKPRVIYHTNIPSPYMVDRFNRIAGRGNIDLEVLFHERRHPDRSWDVREEDWRFRYRYMGPGKAGHVLGPARHIRKARPDVVVSLYESAPYVLGLAAAKSVTAKTVIRVLKVFDTWRQPRRSREWAKHLVFPRVDGIQVAGSDSSAYAMRYGAAEHQLHAFGEPVDVQHFAMGSSRDARSMCERERLGLSGCVFVCVGRLVPEKGLEYLLEAYRQLTSQRSDVSVLFVGDGAHEAQYRAQTSRLSCVAFSGSVQQGELPFWYGLSDILVLPSLGDPYGHVAGAA